MALTKIEFDFRDTFNGSRVDREKGVIRGVSIITQGVKARGHNLEVDAETLDGMLACALEMGSVPVKWNHRSGADAVNGYLEDFRIQNGKLRGDWHLLKKHPQFEHALELAERMPGNVGLSAAFMGEDETRNGKKKARCEELISVDLVAQPAANPDGLFSVPEPNATPSSVDIGKKSMANKPTSEPTLADVMARLNEMADTHQQFQEQVTARIEATEQFQQQVIAGLADDEGEEDSELDDFENEGEGIDEGEGEGEPAGVGAEVGEPSGGTQLSGLFQRVRELEAHNANAEQAKAQELREHYLSSIEGRFIELESELHEKTTELEALREAFKTRGATFIKGSPGHMRMFERGGSNGGRADDPVTEFSDFVADLAEQKKITKGAAVRLATKMNPGLHQRYLAAKGIVKSMED